MNGGIPPTFDHLFAAGIHGAAVVANLGGMVDSEVDLGVSLGRW